MTTPQANANQAAWDAVPTIPTVAEAVAFELPIGKKVRITERDSALFEVVASGSPDGYGRIAAKNGDLLIDSGQELTAVMFGADPTGASDSYAAIMAGLAYGRIIADGSFITSDTILIVDNQALHLADNTTISASFVATKPVVRVSGTFAHLTGSGWSSEIQTDNATNDADPTKEGIVNIGPVDQTTGVNINWSAVSNLKLTGSSSRWIDHDANTNHDIDDDIGLKMVNGDYFDIALSSSTFNVDVSKLMMQLVGKGIDCSPVVQGCNFSSLYWYRCTKYGIRFVGCKENSVDQTFAHSSAGLVMLKLEVSDTGGIGDAAYDARPSGGNSFTNFNGEPGATGPDGRFARHYEIDTGCNGNHIQGRGNTGHSAIDNGLGNIILANTEGYAVLSSDGINNFTHDFNASGTNNLSGDTDIIGGTNNINHGSGYQVFGVFDRKESVYEGPLAVGESIRLTYTSASRRMVMYKISVAGSYVASNSLSRHPIAEYIVGVLADSTGAVVTPSGPTMLHGNTFVVGDLTVTAAGSGFQYYIDIRQPGANDLTGISVVVEQLAGVNSSTLNSVTVI